MYSKKDNLLLIGLVVVHVDDMLITGVNGFVSNFYDKIKATFEVSKDEPLSHFLSLLITSKSPKEPSSINHIIYVICLKNSFLKMSSQSRLLKLAIPSC